MSSDESSPPDGRSRHGAEPLSAEIAAEIAASLSALRFGQVVLVVQDGVIVQIDRLERRRLDRRASA